MKQKLVLMHDVLHLVLSFASSRQPNRTLEAPIPSPESQRVRPNSDAVGTSLLKIHERYNR